MPDALKVLVVDDSAIYRSLVQGCLREMPDLQCVGTANDGKDAIAKAGELRPDIILLDVEMPDLDGIEVCRQVKEDAELKHIPVIILTATQDPKLNERSFKAGAEITILKSVPGERLLNMLRLSLEKGRPSA